LFVFKFFFFWFFANFGKALPENTRIFECTVEKRRIISIPTAEKFHSPEKNLNTAYTKDIEKASLWRGKRSVKRPQRRKQVERSL
jgi:hypothetical protein